jgi:hypothetical protein
MENDFSFSSPELQKENAELELLIDEHRQKIINASNDINALEAKLKNAGIPFCFVYVLSVKSELLLLDLSNDPEEMGPCEDVGRSIEHCLVWGKTNTNNFRLSYCIYQVDTQLELDHEANIVSIIEERDPVLIFSRPLIETKAHLRLRIEPELPIFYRMLVGALRSTLENDMIVVESPVCQSVGQSSALSMFVAKRDALQQARQ